MYLTNKYIRQFLILATYMNNPVMNICKPTFVFWWVFKSRSWLSIRNTRIPYDASKTVKFLVTMYIMVTISVYADTTTAIFVVFSWGDLRTCDYNEAWIMGKLFKEIFWSKVSFIVQCTKDAINHIPKF